MSMQKVFPLQDEMFSSGYCGSVGYRVPKESCVFAGCFTVSEAGVSHDVVVSLSKVVSMQDVVSLKKVVSLHQVVLVQKVFFLCMSICAYRKLYLGVMLRLWKTFCVCRLFYTFLKSISLQEILFLQI